MSEKHVLFNFQSSLDDLKIFTPACRFEKIIDLDSQAFDIVTKNVISIAKCIVDLMYVAGSNVDEVWVKILLCFLMQCFHYIWTVA